MPDHITTEDAERMALYLENYDPSPNNMSGRLAIARALRALAAERDALKAENERTLGLLDGEVVCALCGDIYNVSAALGEEGP